MLIQRIVVVHFHALTHIFVHWSFVKRVTALLAFLPLKIYYCAKQWVPLSAVRKGFIGWCSERPQVGRVFSFFLNIDNSVDVKRLFRLDSCCFYGMAWCHAPQLKNGHLLFVREMLTDFYNRFSRPIDIYLKLKDSQTCFVRGRISWVKVSLIIAPKFACHLLNK